MVSVKLVLSIAILTLLSNQLPRVPAQKDNSKPSDTIENDHLIDKDLEFIIEDSELRKDISEYLNIVPTSHKTFTFARKLFNYTTKADDQTTAKAANSKLANRSVYKDVLNLVLQPIRDKEAECKNKKCKPCDKTELICPYCPPCKSQCPFCPLPDSCIPARADQKCPPKVECGCPTSPRPTTTGKPGYSANKVGASTTKKSQNKLTTTEKCKCKTQKPCPYTSTTTTKPNSKFRKFSSRASSLGNPPKSSSTTKKPTSKTSTSTKRPSTTSTTPKSASKKTTTTKSSSTTSTTARSSSKTPTTTKRPSKTSTTTMRPTKTSTTTKPPSKTSTTTKPPSKMSTTTVPPSKTSTTASTTSINFNLTVSVTTTITGSVQLELERNLKILLKDDNARSDIMKLLTEVPTSVGGKETELAGKILSKMGDPIAKLEPPMGSLGELKRVYTYMNSRLNLLKILNFLFDSTKRKKCNCNICLPKDSKECPECNSKPCEVNVCDPCPKQKICPAPPNCPTYAPCGKCKSQALEKDPADDDGNLEDLDDVDHENVIVDGELDKDIECKDGYTCKFKDSCGQAVLNPLTPKEKQSGYLNGGEDEIYGEWPQHARIAINLTGKNEMQGNCSGVLISDKHVLTAGHCTQLPEMGALELKPESFTVSLGDHDLKIKDKFEKHFKVTSICKLKKFNNHGGFESRYDLAVLTLNQTVTFSDHIQPACLNYKPLKLTKSTKCFVIGAGITKYSHLGDHKYSSIVQKMSVERTSCKNWGIRHDDRSRHCFTKREGKGDACGGDSGGPILCLSKGAKRWTIGGLVSYGTEKCDGTETVGWVGVYARVPALLKSLKEECKI